MPTEFLFEPLSSAGASPALVDVVFNGEPVQVPEGANLAAALLACGVRRFRKSPVSGSGRAPYCMMGACFECLLEIDGVPNRQACLVPVRSGMQIRTQDTLPDSLLESRDPALTLAQSMEAHHGR